MKAVVQRVVDASVTVDGVITGQIDHGLLVYLGVEQDDTVKDRDYIARKLSGLRIFTDENGKMNHSVKQSGGDILLISQFTLCADTKKGNRPSFNGAMAPDKANEFYVDMQKTLQDDYGIRVAMGSFGAHMDVAYVNDGPVTIILDSN